jgi:general secretion pathway protein D
MKKIYRLRPALAVAIVLLIALPSVIFAADGKKHFKQGLKYEVNKQWDKAAQEYAFASAEAPSNVEYILHLQRALVSAGIMLSERGDMLAQQKDYNAAYAAYRQAASYDPTNEVAKFKMRRMLEAQGLASPDGEGDGSSKANKIETTFKPGASANEQPTGSTGLDALATDTANKYVASHYRSRDVVFRGATLRGAIENLASTMKLNVIFDSNTEQMLARPTAFSVDLKDVTPARALEMILTTNGLMYAPIDSRTIVIANDNQQTRMKYEMQAVRVFYVKTGDINDMRNALSPLGIKQIIAYKQLNAFVIRDTPANLEVAEHVLKSLDKDKAEVLIDINMYQVSHNNLLSLGNQFALGDPTKGTFGLQGGFGGIGANLIQGATRSLTGPFGIALGLPGSSVTAFQSTGNAKLLASTQVHVLDGEQHTIRLGQRVPIQTASYPFVGNPVSPTGTAVPPGTPGAPGTPNSPGSSLLSSSAFGFGIPQIQYENVGLNIDMTPSVTSDEVQMKMKIDSTSIDGSTSTLTPTFNQTTMSAVAKIRDGQTTMIAGISQNTQSKNVKGLPLIGLIPILGRFFTTPDNQNNQSDVVITVTPHILRSAEVTGEDHLTVDIGPEQNPRRQLTIEQILYRADRELAQQNPVAAGKDSPDPLTLSPPAKAVGIVGPIQPSPGVFVSSDGSGVAVMPVPTETSTGAATTTATPANPATNKPAVPVKTVKTSAQTTKPVDDDDDDDDDASSANKTNSPVQVIIRASPVATKGQQLAAAVITNGDTVITGASVALTYDPNMFEVKGVRNGGMLNAGGVDVEPQFSADSGVLNVTLQRPDGTAGIPARGQLLYVILEVKGKGKTTLGLGELTSFRTASGSPVPVSLQGATVEVK